MYSSIELEKSSGTVGPAADKFVDDSIIMISSECSESSRPHTLLSNLVPGPSLSPTLPAGLLRLIRDERTETLSLKKERALSFSAFSGTVSEGLPLIILSGLRVVPDQRRVRKSGLAIPKDARARAMFEKRVCGREDSDQSDDII